MILFLLSFHRSNLRFGSRDFSAARILGLFSSRSALQDEAASIEGRSNISSYNFTTIVADGLEDLLDFCHESVMKDRCS